MKHLFKPEIFKKVFAILVLLLIVKVLWFIVEVLWLPSHGVDYADDRGDKALYYRVKLTPNKIAAPIQHIAPPVKQADRGSIKDIKLLAIYNDSKITVVTVNYKSKSKVLSRGDEINGYILRGAGNDFATFSKNSKLHKVFLIKDKTSNNNLIKEVNSAPASLLKPKPKAESKNNFGEVIDAGDHKIVDRSLLDHYAKNMKDIYKNIGIAEVKDGEKLKGFWITFVRHGSPFSKLGIKKDDVIKSINGKEITSYNAAFSMYKNIKNMENLTLVIQRGNEEMELEYEIK